MNLKIWNKIKITEKIKQRKKKMNNYENRKKIFNTSFPIRKLELKRNQILKIRLHYQMFIFYYIVIIFKII